jgi:hypothetical protein
MKWAMLFGITVCVLLIFLFQLPRLKADQKKEKIAVVILLMFGWLLSAMLVFFPNIPGPDYFITAIFKWLGFH